MKALLRWLALLPIISSLIFYSFVVGWRLYLGRWPSYGAPDAGALHGFPLALDIILFIVLSVSAFSIVPMISLVVVGIVTRRHGALWPSGPLAIASWLLFVVLFHFDPGAFLNWYLD